MPYLAKLVQRHTAAQFGKTSDINSARDWARTLYNICHLDNFATPEQATEVKEELRALVTGEKARLKLKAKMQVVKGGKPDTLIRRG